MFGLYLGMAAPGIIELTMSGCARKPCGIRIRLLYYFRDVFVEVTF